MALTGYLFNGACYGTDVEYINAILSQPPVLNGSASISIRSVDLTVFPGQAWITYDYSDIWSTMTAFNNYAPVVMCDPLTGPLNLNQIFAMPDPVTVGQAWMLGFGLPVTLWLVAWGFGVVINSFKDD